VKISSKEKLVELREVLEETVLLMAIKKATEDDIKYLQ